MASRGSTETAAGAFSVGSAGTVETATKRDAGESPAVAATAPALDMQALAGLLGELVAKELAPLREEVASLKGQVTQQRESLPQFQPQRRADPPSGLEARRQAFADLKKGEGRAGVINQIPTGPQGVRLPDAVFQQFSPRFDAGDQVRLNPEAVREGGETAWREICTRVRLDPEATFGQVTKRLWLSGKTGEWKYKVRFRGLTKPEGDGFYDYELLAPAHE